MKVIIDSYPRGVIYFGFNFCVEDECTMTAAMTKNLHSLGKRWKRYSNTIVISLVLSEVGFSLRTRLIKRDFTTAYLRVRNEYFEQNPDNRNGMFNC